MGRLDRGDRATDTEPVRRYQRDRPGELIHVDVKKIAGIPHGGGWRVHGRGFPGDFELARKTGYRYIHSALDDRTRLVYSEIHDDEQALTAVGFWHRACAATNTTVKKTRPRRPQTNGKIERFHRILLEQWAYIRPWTSERERHRGYQRFLHFYNQHRSHGALGWATPAATLATFRDNLHAEHN